MTVPAWASRYVGIPFVSGGRDASGCDCYGLVRLALAEQFGYRLPELSAEYQDALAIAEAELTLKARLPLLAGTLLDKAEAGAVAVIRFQGRPSHIGIFVSETHIMHTLVRIGAHIVRAESSPLRGGIQGVYRVHPRYRVTASV